MCREFVPPDCSDDHLLPASEMCARDHVLCFHDGNVNDCDVGKVIICNTKTCTVEYELMNMDEN